LRDLVAIGLYETLLLVHVLAVVFLIGTIPLEYLLVRRTIALGDRPRIARLLRDLDWVETRIAVPAALLLVGSGLGMTVGPLARWRLFSTEALFPAVGLGLFVVLLVLFAGIVPAHYKKIIRWAEGEDPTPPGRAWEAWSLAGALIGLSAVTIMVLKPF
jgi:hypothetical protein